MENNNIKFGLSVKKTYKEIINLIGRKGDLTVTDKEVINYVTRQIGKVDEFIERNK